MGERDFCASLLLVYVCVFQGRGICDSIFSRFAFSGKAICGRFGSRDVRSSKNGSRT